MLSIGSLFGGGDDPASLYVGRLSPGTTTAQLYQAFAKFRRNWGGAKLHRKTLPSGEVIHWAVVTLSSAKAARKAVQAMDGMVVRGQRVQLRDYHDRTVHNERRAPGWRNRPWNGLERRKHDRRRYELRQAPPDDLFDATAQAEADELEVETPYAISTAGYRDHSRKLG